MLFRSKIALFGASAYKSIAGGTGSSNVNKEYIVDISDGLVQAGYNISPLAAAYYEKYNKAQELQVIERASKTRGTVTGIPTGFIDLDYKLSGLQRSDLILIAARPSMGKTAFVLNIAQHVAFRQNLSVAVFSLEMSKEQLVNRLFSLESHVDAQLLRTGNLKDTDWEKLIEGAGIIGKSRLIIDDTSGISIAEMRSKCRKFKLEQNLDLIKIGRAHV